MPKLKSHIGQKVQYGPPASTRRGANLVGEIVDEVWAIEAQRDPPEHDHDDLNCWGDYAFCSQLIQWQNGGYSIRLAYYHLPCKGPVWKFASQTTVDTKPSIIKPLRERTLAKAIGFLNQRSGPTSKLARIIRGLRFASAAWHIGTGHWRPGARCGFLGPLLAFGGD